MTLYFHDGFDHYGTTQDFYASNYIGTSSPVVGNSSPSTALNYGKWANFGVNSTFRNIVSPSTNALTSLVTTIVGFRVNFRATVISCPIIAWADSLNGNAIQVQLATNGAGQLQFYRGLAATTPIGPPGTSLLNINTWYEIECKVTINNTTGSVECRLNSVSGEIPSTTSLNTRGSTTTNTDQMRWNNGALQTTLFDDLYMLDPTTGGAPDNTFLSIAAGWRVQTNTTAANSSVQWTPNGAAANWQCVNQLTPDGDTTYNSTASAAQTDLFTMTALLGTPAIFGVTLSVMARKDDASVRSLTPKLSSSGTVVSGFTVALPQTYDSLMNVYEQDPHTSAQWVYTAVNAVITGYTSV